MMAGYKYGIIPQPKELTNMPIKLTKREVASFRSGPVYGTGRAFKYKVGGMPPGEEATITESPNQGWRILRTKNGVQGDWTGEYESADEALAALQKEFDNVP